MKKPARENPFISELRERCGNEGDMFWLDSEKSNLVAFDPQIAKQINLDNFADLTIPDKLSDELKGKSGCPFSWSEIKGSWFKKMQFHTQPNDLEQLTNRMTELIDQHLNKPVNLVVAIQEIFSQPLIDTVIKDLPPRHYQRILADQKLKIKPFTIESPPEDTFTESLVSAYVQVKAGMSVRKELRARAKKNRPRKQDLLDPIVDMLPRLGMDRAIDAVTMVLTAIAGPPGAAASCMIYELTTSAHWNEKLKEELSNVSLAELFEKPTHVAPITYRFVKEVLRKWSPPVISSRVARTEIKFMMGNKQEKLTPGQQYMLSPYLIHHNPKYWRDPEKFDPDRWLSGSDDIAKQRSNYIPFGWAPKSCIGQTLGTYQLIILAYLMCTKYKITLNEPEKIEMILEGMPLPLKFSGVIEALE
jgi:cytochrome P450